MDDDRLFGQRRNPPVFRHFNNRFIILNIEADLARGLATERSLRYVELIH